MSVQVKLADILIWHASKRGSLPFHKNHVDIDKILFRQFSPAGEMCILLTSSRSLANQVRCSCNRQKYSEYSSLLNDLTRNLNFTWKLRFKLSQINGHTDTIRFVSQQTHDVVNGNDVSATSFDIMYLVGCK